MASPSHSRAPRRGVRLPCWLRFGSHEVLTSTANVSVNGLYLRLSAQAPGVTVPEVGARVEVKLTLPNTPLPFDSRADVAWVNHNDRDTGGQPKIGIGLSLVDPSPEGLDQLEHFVRTFRHHLLVVDDDRSLAETYKGLSLDYQLHTSASAEEAYRLLAAHEVSVLITAERVSGASCVEFLGQVAERFPFARLLRILTCHPAPAEDVQELIREAKLFAVLDKPFTSAQLESLVYRAVDSYALALENERLSAELERANQRLVRENAYLRKRVIGQEGFENMIGQSPALRALLSEVQRLRRTDVTVHIQGETGTGKELIARALHHEGPRAQGPLISQNCAGLTESLLQSTLFGHKRGAFTGADRDHLGVFQQANAGTLFLDEVAELPLSIQAALLRALEEGEVVPLGGSAPVKVSLRIISATHKDLREEVKAGRFREDLYFRLVVVSLRLPPLRERKGDVALLACHFLQLQCERFGKNIPGFAPETMRALEAYPWPGNIRQLENEIARAVVLADEKEKIPLDQLSEDLRTARTSGSPTREDWGAGKAVLTEGLTYDEAVVRLEKALIASALQKSGGVISRAAALLGIERTRLTKLKKRLEVGS